MHQFRRVVTMAVILAALVPAVPAAASPAAELAPTRHTGLSSADDPVSEAVAQAERRARQAGGAVDVVLATTGDFADALAGSALVGVTPDGGGPLLDELDGRAPQGRVLLMTSSDRLLGQVADFLGRYTSERSTVWLLGGTTALSDRVQTQVEAATDADVVRLAGDDRVATALQVASTVVAQTGAAPPVYVARADGPGSAGWVDALVLAPALASDRDDADPVLLLTEPGRLDPRVARWLERTDHGPVTVVGGPQAITPHAAGQVEATTGDRPRRLAGPTRHHTAAAVATDLFDLSIDRHRITDVPVKVVDSTRPDAWAWALAHTNGTTALLYEDLASGGYDGLLRGCGQRPLRPTLLVGDDRDALRTTIDQGAAAIATGCTEPWQTLSTGQWDTCRGVTIHGNFTNAPTAAEPALIRAAQILDAASPMHIRWGGGDGPPAPEGNPQAVSALAQRTREKFGDGHVSVAWPAEWPSPHLAYGAPSPWSGTITAGGSLVGPRMTDVDGLTDLLVHELGHALNLDHTLHDEQVMFPIVPSGTHADGTLGAGDRAGLADTGSTAGC